MLLIIADVIIIKQIMIVMTIVKVNPGESLTIVWAVKAGVAPSSLGSSNFDGFADRLTSNRNGNRDRFLVGPVRKQ